MKADLNAAARRERVLRYASYGLMVLSPFLLLGVLSLILGRSALDSWPVWTDELDYWRSLQNWNAVGFATGYSGLSEIVPEAGNAQRPRADGHRVLWLVRQALWPEP